MSDLSAQKEVQYLEEINLLRRRLFEAEAMAQALPASEIDAVSLSERSLLLLRQAQQALKEREKTFLAVFEGATDAMVIADDAGRYLQVNSVACELFGIAETELLGKTAAHLAPPDFNFAAAWRAFQESGQETGEFELLRPGGSIRVAEYSTTTHFLSHL